MGGSIALAVKLPDGREGSWEVSTNSFPYTFCNPRLTDVNSVAFQDFTAPATPEFARRMARAGIKPRMFSRITSFDYGLILVDFPSRRILSCNGYSNIGSMTAWPSGRDLCLVRACLDHHTIRTVGSPFNDEQLHGRDAACFCVKWCRKISVLLGAQNLSFINKHVFELTVDIPGWEVTNLPCNTNPRTLWADHYHPFLDAGGWTMPRSSKRKQK